MHAVFSVTLSVIFFNISNTATRGVHLFVRLKSFGTSRVTIVLIMTTTFHLPFCARLKFRG